MNRDKQIEEMALGDAKFIINDTVYFISNEDDRKYIEGLLNGAGYRKTSDIAREIFEEIESCIWSETHYGDSKLCFEINSAKYAELKKKHTKEITEGGE